MSRYLLKGLIWGGGGGQGGVPGLPPSPFILYRECLPWEWRFSHCTLLPPVVQDWEKGSLITEGQWHSTQCVQCCVRASKGCWWGQRWIQLTLPNPNFYCLTAVSACVLNHFSHVWLFATPWTVAHQTPLSMGFSRQEHRSGLPCPPLGDLPDPGMEPASLRSPVLAGRFFTTSAF